MSTCRYIFTGGPGSGKTTLLNQLNHRKYRTYSEIATSLMQEGIQAPINSQTAPSFFASEVLKRRISDFQDSEKYSLSFFDRGIPDALGFSYYLNSAVNVELIHAINTYRYSHALIFPPWKAIYRNTEIRKEKFTTAVKIYDCLIKAYTDSKYDLIEVPIGDCQSRLEFIENFVLETQNNQCL